MIVALSMRARCGVFLALILVLGCSKPAPRTATSVATDRLSLPGLFLTVSGQRKIAPRNSLPFVDAQTKEIYWPALECTNPACPGRAADGQPFLFAFPSPGASVAANGAIEYHDVKPEEYQSPACPACLKHRALADESPADRARYQAFVQPYTLPETAAREQELDSESAKISRGGK